MNEITVNQITPNTSVRRTSRVATRTRRGAAGFTLTELLVAIAVASMLAAMTLTAMYSATQSANQNRTRGIVNKINELLLQQWSEIESRRISYVVLNDPRLRPRQRLYYQRQLMRLEFPDRKSDLLAPANAAQATARYRGYLRTIARIYGNGNLSDDDIRSTYITDHSRWTLENQHAECLYLILASTRIDDGSALDYFSNDEIGDKDGDGMKEILDSWGNPIFYLRWAPGHVQEAGVPDATQSAAQGTDGPLNPDSLDVLRADVIWSDADYLLKPYQLYPLVVSAGRDGAFDMVFDFDGLIYAAERAEPSDALSGNNPYVARCRTNPATSYPKDSDCGVTDASDLFVNVLMLGSPFDTDGSSFTGAIDNFEDNITNQQSQVR